MAPDNFQNLGLIFEGDDRNGDEGTSGASATKS